jgi:hypothetical protein
MKSEITVDRAAARARAPRGSPRTTLTDTTHHLSHGDTAETWGPTSRLVPMRRAGVNGGFRGDSGT